MTDARMDAARAIVRIKTTVRKENPTSTAVHVDSVMGTPRPRAKKRKKPILVDETVDKGRGGLGKWFDEKWVDISRPKEGGGYEECGRSDASEGKYPKCVPQSKANSMTAGEKKSAVRRKRDAESSETREGKKPINVATFAKAENIPTDKELYARVKAEAKKKFDVYPSAYANAWLVQEYKRRGGKYRVGKASFSSRSEAGRYAAQQRWAKHKKTDGKKKQDETRVARPEPSDTATGFIQNVKEAGTKAFDIKNLEASAKYLQSKGAGNGTMSEEDKTISDNMRNLMVKTLDEESAKVSAALKQLADGGDKEGAIKELRSSASRLRRASTRIAKEQKAKGLFAMKLADNTVGGMAMTTLSKIFANVADAVLREVASVTGKMEKASSPAWQREEGKNPKGGLNAKGRASYKRETGGTLRPPVKSGDNPRRASFLARMGNAKGPEYDENGEPTRLLLSLRAWGANSKAEARKKAKAISARNKAKKGS